MYQFLNTKKSQDIKAQNLKHSRSQLVHVWEAVRENLPEKQFPILMHDKVKML